MAIVDLTARRLGRLEKGQQETNDRLGRVEDALGRVVDVLEVHSRHFERMEEALIGISERVDRLTSAIARGRTQDLVRLQDHERRLRVLERRNGRRRRKS
jgi:archaellum component FlaC